MAGTKAGGAKASKTMRARYGDGYYKILGSRGGLSLHKKPRGFATNRALARAAGAKGGTISRKKIGLYPCLPGDKFTNTVRMVLYRALKNCRTFCDIVEDITAEDFSAHAYSIDKMRTKTILAFRAVACFTHEISEKSAMHRKIAIVNGEQIEYLFSALRFTGSYEDDLDIIVAIIELDNTSYCLAYDKIKMRPIDTANIGRNKIEF
jgi:hypothetical protein|nr:MAG TPA: hypothetical protein [Caudoviricetes sp.]